MTTVVKAGDMVRITITGTVERTGNSGAPGDGRYVLVAGYWFRPSEYELVTAPEPSGSTS